MLTHVDIYPILIREAALFNVKVRAGHSSEIGESAYTNVEMDPFFHLNLLSLVGPGCLNIPFLHAADLARDCQYIIVQVELGHSKDLELTWRRVVVIFWSICS
jgi:hypothetical protein